MIAYITVGQPHPHMREKYKETMYCIDQYGMDTDALTATVMEQSYTQQDIALIGGVEHEQDLQHQRRLLVSFGYSVILDIYHIGDVESSLMHTQLTGNRHA